MRIRPFRAFFSFVLPFVLVLLVAAGLLSLAHARTQQLAATYSRGNVSVTIPYHSTREGHGRLIVEILDPEDHVLGCTERGVDIAKVDDAWTQVITAETPIPFDDIVGSASAIASSTTTIPFPQLRALSPSHKSCGDLWFTSLGKRNISQVVRPQFVSSSQTPTTAISQKPSGLCLRAAIRLT